MRRKLDAIQAYLGGGFQLLEINTGNHHMHVVLLNRKGWRLTVTLDRRDAEEILYGSLTVPGARLRRDGAEWKRVVRDSCGA